MENMFWEGLSLASELGAMDQKRLGNETRHEEEIAARRSLEATFAKRHEELTRRLNAFDQALQSDVSELIEHLRTGEADFRSEEHTSALQSLMRISYAVFCLKNKMTLTPATARQKAHTYQQKYHVRATNTIHTVTELR